ncbi:MAG: phosphotransferase [Bacteroidales bacterium]|nr:phosphotransferase [Bacteroidales bacterium]
MKVQPEIIIASLYESWSGKKPDSVQAIAASGSPRKYFRLVKGNQTVIGAYNPDLKENEAFLSFTKHFHSRGLPVPELLDSDPEKGIYIVSDLGNKQLFDLIVSREYPEHISDELYSTLADTVRILPHFQVEGGRDLDYSVCYPRSVFDRQSMLWDLNYFKYYILKTSGITFNEQLLENDFLRFTKFLLHAGQEHFMYRDFQSRNVMLMKGKPWFIDYQGGRKGPLQYDLASFLYQVKAHFPEEIKKKLINEYLDELAKLDTVDRDVFMKYFYPFVYLRLFQVLGAYGFRGLFEKRPHFAESLEPAVAGLARLLNAHPLEPELTELTSALRKLTQSSKYLPVHHKKSGLTVSISSFAYKHGKPEDKTGNGGGFVYDCRSLPNPGRLEEYREQTGRDKAVINYLSTYREVDKFLHNVFDISDSAIENYIERSFDNLSISFGCTGGQHRSVYCADRLAEHLSGKYVITVKLHHREQQITETRKEQHE